LWPAKSVSNGGAMKDAVDSLPADRSVEAEGFANRKLIRPSLNRTDHNHAQASMSETRERTERPDRPERGDRPAGGGRKPAPPEQTNAENFYYQKQMQSKTPMVIVLRDGEEIHGMIEWYDKSCLKVTRNSQSNLLIYKPAIKYMFKEGENKK
jgi:host factor-I protein